MDRSRASLACLPSSCCTRDWDRSRSGRTSRSVLAERTGCGVLVYSRYGHGNSDRLLEKRPVSFMHHEGAGRLAGVAEPTFGIERPILFGHSDGGSIALIYAGTFPESPRALILEAPHVFVEDLSVESIAAAKVNFQTTDFREKLAKYHAHVDETFWGWNDIWLDPAFRSWNIEEYLDCDSLSGPLHSGRTGRVRHPGAGGGDSQSRSWHRTCYACRLQTFAASRSAGEDAGCGGEVREAKV